MFFYTKVQVNEQGIVVPSAIGLNQKLVEFITRDETEFMLESLQNGIPSFIGYKNGYLLFSNVLQYLFAAFLNNFGIFFNNDKMQDDYVIKRYDYEIIPVDCQTYNSSIVTEHYHERSIVRVLQPKSGFIKKPILNQIKQRKH